MLWYKSWLETRWRFVIGMVLLTLSACATVFTYPEVMRLLPLASNAPKDGEIGRLIQEAMQLSSSYRGYVWSQWFRQNMLQMLAFFAVILGTGGLLSQSSRGGTFFTLSLPVTRNRLLGVRAATGLAELVLLAFVPPLLIPMLSPAVGQSYGIGDVLVHSGCMFIAGTVFFSLAFLLSTVFNDVWRPMLIVLCTAAAVAFFQFVRRPGANSFFGVMTGEGWFRSGELPWLGLLLQAALSIALLYAATRNIARQDF